MGNAFLPVSSCWGFTGTPRTQSLASYGRGFIGIQPTAMFGLPVNPHELRFDDLTVLRKLAADAAFDEHLFRQLVWTVKSGVRVPGAFCPPGHGSVLRQAILSKAIQGSVGDRPRFLMHLILCLERLIIDGVTHYIKRQS